MGVASSVALLFAAPEEPADDCMEDLQTCKKANAKKCAKNADLAAACPVTCGGCGRRTEACEDKMNNCPSDAAGCADLSAKKQKKCCVCTEEEHPPVPAPTPKPDGEADPDCLGLCTTQCALICDAAGAVDSAEPASEGFAPGEWGNPSPEPAEDCEDTKAVCDRARCDSSDSYRKKCLATCGGCRRLDMLV